MKLRRKNKNKKCITPKRGINPNKKDIYEIIGIPSDVILNEPRLVLVGEYLLEFYNHRGIIDLSETTVKINTKKAIYIISGTELVICEMTDDKISISGKISEIKRD